MSNYNTSEEAQAKFKEKRKPKNPIKFKLALNPEQKEAKSKILLNEITVLGGAAGSGKTMLACQVALDQLFSRKVERIIITRPTVSKEEIGFLPGDLKDKLDPWIQPIVQNMFLLYDKVKVEKLMEEGTIEIVPLAFMRGRTFLNSFIIVDEAQNVTNNQMEMIATRIGLNSKMVICGDDRQVDLRNKSESGFKLIYNAGRKVSGMDAVHLQTNHRAPIVEKLITYYEELSEKGIVK